MSEEKKAHRVVWAITERSDGRSRWTRVGTAFENRDGSMNLYLDALPVSGRLQVREQNVETLTRGPARFSELPEQLAG